MAYQFNRTTAWLRLLERQGVLPAPRRDFSGRRYYLDEDIEAIREGIRERYRAKHPVA